MVVDVVNLVGTAAGNAPSSAGGDVLLTVLVVARDAEAHLVRLIGELTAQDVPSACWELIVVVDPATVDASAESAVAASAALAVPVRVVGGSAPGLARGWNDGLELARGAWIIRLDAHGRYPASFLHDLLAEVVRGGGDAIGGPVLLEADPNRPASVAIAAAERSVFVSGAVSPFKREVSGDVALPFVARAAYRRGVFEQVGGFRSMRFACEDTEFAARFRRCHFTYRCTERIQSMHFVRGDLRSLWRQKFRNGGAVWDMLLHRTWPTPASKLVVSPTLVSLAAVVLVSGPVVGSALSGAAVTVVLAEAWRVSRRDRAPVGRTALAIAVALAAYGVGGLWAVLRRPFGDSWGPTG